MIPRFFPTDDCNTTDSHIRWRFLEHIFYCLRLMLDLISQIIASMFMSYKYSYCLQMLILLGCWTVYPIRCLLYHKQQRLPCTYIFFWQLAVRYLEVLIAAQFLLTGSLKLLAPYISFSFLFFLNAALRILFLSPVSIQKLVLPLRDQRFLH